MDLDQNSWGGVCLKLSQDVQIMPQVMLVSLKGGQIEIGESSEIGMYSRIASQGYVKIGNNVITGPNVFIADFNHEYRNPYVSIKKQGNHFIPTEDGSPNIIIGDNTWIGTNVVILGNVHIGKQCVIGANSVVTKDIPDYCVAVGTPAKVVKRYSFENDLWERI